MELVTAVKMKSFGEIVDLVAKKGIPINNKWSDYKALNIAIASGKKTIAYFLLAKGCRINKIIANGEKPSNTPLHHAVKLENYKLVNLLLKKNASVIAVNSGGNSPLHLAYMLRCEKIIDRLLNFIQETAALKNLKNKHGLTHFHIACTRSNENLVLSYMSIAAVSLSDSVKKNSQKYYAGYTTLQFAMQSKSPFILKHLLEHIRSLSSVQVTSSLKSAQDELECAAAKIHLLNCCAQISENNYLSQFHIACMEQNPNLVKLLLDCGALVNEPIKKESTSCPLFTPLHLAVESNCKESVLILLEYGADPDLNNIRFMTPLHLSQYSNNQEILDILYAQAKKQKPRMNLTDCYGLCYFHIAVSMNDFDFVYKCLNEGQEVNAHVLANSPNFSGYTPLHFAVRYGHMEMAKLLIKNGANVNACDNIQDGTPLHIAFSLGHNHLISLLLEHESLIDCLRPCDKKTMLHLLVEEYINTGERNNPQVILHVKQLVFDCKVDIDAQDKDGNTALHYACLKISVGAPCIQELIERGADINIVNAMGVTPFEVSFYSNYCNNPADYMLLYNHIQKLKELGLAVNEKNNECCASLLKERQRALKGVNSFRTRSLKQKHEKRVSELKRMKNVELWPDVSVHDFVQMNSLGLRALGPNAHLTTKIKFKCFKRQFPYFGYFVDLQWRKLKLYSS